MRASVLAFSLLLALAAPALAQEDESAPDPIDTALDACLEKPEGQSTAGMLECLSAAYGAWDRELNKVYGELQASLDPESKKRLLDAQRKWLAFRDAERDFLGGPWTADLGTLVRVANSEAMVDLVKSRVLALRAVSDR